MYNKHTKEGYRSTIKGIQQKTLVYGQNTLMAELKMSKGTRIFLTNTSKSRRGIW